MAGENRVFERPELESYTDQEQGFTLLKPASWPKVRISLNLNDVNTARRPNVAVAV
jgi:hypothetical protein